MCSVEAYLVYINKFIVFAMSVIREMCCNVAWWKWKREDLLHTIREQEQGRQGNRENLTRNANGSRVADKDLCLH